MATIKLKEETLLEGIIGVTGTTNPKIKMLHEAANSLNIEGFKVTRLRVFEDPLTAQIEIENTIPQKALLATFIEHANQAFKPLNHRFFVVLTVTDFTDPSSGVEITYSIHRRQAGQDNTRDEISIAIANKMASGLVSAIE